MTLEPSVNGEAHHDRALQTTIQIGLSILLVTTCLLILRPFIPLIIWGIIIAVASYPAFRRLQTSVGERGGPAAVVFTLVPLAVLIIPVFLLAKSLIEGVQTLTAHMKNGTLTISPPPRSIET